MVERTQILILGFAAELIVVFLKKESYFKRRTVSIEKKIGKRLGGAFQSDVKTPRQSSSVPDAGSATWLMKVSKLCLTAEQKPKEHDVTKAFQELFQRDVCLRWARC